MLRCLPVAAGLFLVAMPAIADQDPDRGSTCTAYMEAEAIHEEAMAATKAEGILGVISENLFGPSERIEKARRAADQDLYLAYKRAYRGPSGVEEQYTALLVAEDVGLCTVSEFIRVSNETLPEGMKLDDPVGDEEGFYEILKPLGLIKEGF